MSSVMTSSSFSFFLSVIILLILPIAFSHLLTFCILQWRCTMSHLCRAAAQIMHRNYTEMSRLNHIFDLLCVQYSCSLQNHTQSWETSGMLWGKSAWEIFLLQACKTGFFKENSILWEGITASSLNLLDFHVLCVILQLCTRLASPDSSHRAIRNSLTELDKTPNNS